MARESRNSDKRELGCVTITGSLSFSVSVSQSELQRENQRISMRVDLEVLNSVDHIITTSASEKETRVEV